METNICVYYLIHEDCGFLNNMTTKRNEYSHDIE